MTIGTSACYHTYQHFILSDFFFDVIYAFVLSTAQRIVGCYFAYVDQEIREHLFAIGGEINLLKYDFEFY